MGTSVGWAGERGFCSNGAPVCGGVKHPGFLATGLSESLGAVPSAERESAGICLFGTVLGLEWGCVGTL